MIQLELFFRKVLASLPIGETASKRNSDVTTTKRPLPTKKTSPYRVNHQSIHDRLGELPTQSDLQNAAARMGRTPTTRSAEVASKASSAELKLIWDALWQEFFPDRPDLAEYVVKWSGRAQKRTLASCNIDDRRVNVARELRYETLERWWEPLLYHEMCHAVIGHEVTIKNGKCRWHGASFKALELRHPGVALLDQWIKSGGWATAVRSDRAKRSHQRRSGTRR